ncbi:MAG: site-2 protease family protein [Alphaproteobacteria bacterium]
MLIYVLPFIVTLFSFLRYEITHIRFSRRDGLGPLNPLQQAAMDEATALGFVPVIHYTYGEQHDEFPAMLLKHQSLPAFANLYFRALSSFTGYPVWFWSFAKDGSALMTSNRQPTTQDLPGVTHADPYVETLAQHWQAHQDRMSKAALEDISGDEAYGRITRTTESYIGHNLAAKSFVEKAGRIFFSFPRALKMTTECMRQRGKLNKPYKTALMEDEHRSAYYAELYEVHEATRKRLRYRPDIAVTMLILSVVVSFGLFTWLLDWKFSAALILVLFVHECGHAVAMRIFGYKDMSMFFVPFAGAVVTGNVKSISVWKQAIVLLAGPVPGLLFGLWVMMDINAYPPGGFMYMLGLNAAVLNLFNLLPLSFLDGGKLLEIALFSRWPYAIFAFSFLSTLGMLALIFLWKSYNLWIVALVMGASSLLLWRTARVRREWEAQGEDTRTLKGLFDLVWRRYKLTSFNRQYYIVRTVYDKPAVNPPQLWETFLALFLFVFFWGACVAAGTHWQGGRTAQKKFDMAVSTFYSDKSPEAIARLEKLAGELDPADPRQIDLLAVQAYVLPDTARPTALEKILEMNRNGERYKRAYIATRYMNDAYQGSKKDAYAVRIDTLEKAIGRIDALAPDVYASTVMPRLRLAELYDRGGRAAEVQPRLTDLLARTEKVGSGWEHNYVAAVQAWYYLDKGEDGKALAFLERPDLAKSIKDKYGSVSLAYAWALIESGKAGKGLEQMKIATPLAPDDYEEEPLYYADLVYANQKAGHLDDAMTLLLKGRREEYCNPKAVDENLYSDLWQEKRIAALKESLKTVCASLPPKH